MLTRRQSLQSLALLTASSRGILADVLDDEPQLEIIDCHTHFYDPYRQQGVPWPPKKSELYRTVLPKHFRKLKMYRPVTGTVIVEASKWIEDNQWLLDLAASNRFIKGIVGRLDPGETDFAKQVARFGRNRLFRGIRVSHRLLDALLKEKNLAGLKLLADRDLELDVNGSPELLEVVDRAARTMPNLRILVNHLANVDMKDRSPPKSWQDGMSRVAQHPNVYSKVSGLVSSAGRGGRKVPGELAFYRKYLDTVWDAFGEDRLIYGSDWPVSELFADYHTVQRLVFTYFAEKGDQALQKFAALNAKAAYKYLDRNAVP